jgi:hypothetical protein
MKAKIKRVKIFNKMLNKLWITLIEVQKTLCSFLQGSVGKKSILHCLDLTEFIGVLSKGSK